MENKHEQRHRLEEAGALASCPFLAESSPPFIRFFAICYFRWATCCLQFFLSWSATCTPWTGKASEEGYGYWNGIHQKTEQLRSQKRHSSNFSTYLKMKTVGPGISLAIWFRSFAACNAVDSIWIMPGLIVDYHGGETGRHLTFRIFLARKIGYQYSILCSDPMGETWFTRKWDDYGWFISKLGPDVLRPKPVGESWQSETAGESSLIRPESNSQTGMGLSFQDQTPANA